MKTYMVNGEPIEVSLEEEEDFLAEAKEKNITPTLKSDELGKSTGASQPPNNQQQIDTEPKSGDGSSVLLGRLESGDYDYEVGEVPVEEEKEEGCKEATDTAVADCVIGFLVYNHWPVLTADEAAALDW